MSILRSFFFFIYYTTLSNSLFLTLTFHYVIFYDRLKGGDRGNISGVREDRDRDRRNSGGGGGERGPNINKPRDTAPSGGGGGGGGGTTEAPRPSNLSVFMDVDAPKVRIFFIDHFLLTLPSFLLSFLPSFLPSSSPLIGST